MPRPRSRGPSPTAQHRVCCALSWAARARCHCERQAPSRQAAPAECVPACVYPFCMCVRVCAPRVSYFCVRVCVSAPWGPTSVQVELGDPGHALPACDQGRDAGARDRGTQGAGGGCRAQGERVCARELCFFWTSACIACLIVHAPACASGMCMCVPFSTCLLYVGSCMCGMCVLLLQAPERTRTSHTHTSHTHDAHRPSWQTPRAELTRLRGACTSSSCAQQRQSGQPRRSASS